MNQIAIQSLLRPALTPVPRCKDYAVFEQTVQNIDRFLSDSELESQVIDMALEGWEECSAKDQQRRAAYAVRALRVEVLRFLLGGISFRGMSKQLGSSELLADFCRVRELDGIRNISKSNVERYSKLFSEEQIRGLHQTLCEVVGNRDLADWAGLEKPFEMGTCLIDGTCLEANIHFPTDWVLLKDVASTLLKAIKLIRKAGLRHRMPQGPERYARQMNGLCMRMTHSRRRAHSRKERKKILREIKKLLRTVGGHALRHRDLLEQLWEQTGYIAKEAERILERIEAMEAFDLEQPIEALGAARGFASQAARRLLAGQDIYDAMAPRQVDTMVERMQEPRFVRLQRRRAGTEERIGTLKNRWQGGRLWAKGFGNRALAVGWSVLSHNLWQIAKRLAQEDAQREARAA